MIEAVLAQYCTFAVQQRGRMRRRITTAIASVQYCFEDIGKGNYSIILVGNLQVRLELQAMIGMDLWARYATTDWW